MRINKSNKSAVKASKVKKPSQREVNKFIDEMLGQYADYNQKVADVAEEYGLSKDVAENYVWNWTRRGCVDACGEVKASKKVSANDQALTHIKAAIDILGKSGKRDAVTKDSIANLATVMFDIKGSTLLAAKQLSANGLSKGMTIKDIDDGQEFTVGRVVKGEKPNTFDVYDSNDDFVGTYDNAPQFESVD